MQDLYIVHTDIEPVFLESDTRSIEARSGYVPSDLFLEAVKWKHPEFNDQYISIFPDNTLYTSSVMLGRGYWTRIDDGKMAFGGGSIPLHNYLDWLISSEPDLLPSEEINTIIEFSLKELHPETMDILSNRYDLAKPITLLEEEVKRRP